MIAVLPKYDGLNATFNITEDCNLRCKYCYEVDKKPNHLQLEYAKTFIDMLLTDPDPINVSGTPEQWILEKGLVLDFIGGDALMNPQLVREILRYFIWKAVLLDHKWAFRWRASICTNGTLFDKPDVIAFLEEFKGNISLSVSVDGAPIIHDANRIFPNGTGSSSLILKQWDYYTDYCRRSGFSPSIKATLAKDSIPYIYDSLVYIHETLGLPEIHMNFIMEDTGCTEEDYTVFDKQMEKCIEYVYEHRDDLNWSMISREKIGEPFQNTEEGRRKRRCGAGFMPTLGINGFIYPCFRFLPHTTLSQDKCSSAVGSVFEGKFDKKEYINVQHCTSSWSMSDDECRSCEIQSACAYCSAGCYAEFGEFKRTKYICRLAKITSKWAKKYWDKIDGN